MTIATGLPILDIVKWSGSSFLSDGLRSMDEEGWLSNDPIDLFSILDCQTKHEYISYIPAACYSMYRSQRSYQMPNPIVWGMPKIRALQLVEKPLWTAMINPTGFHWQLLCIINHGTPYSIALLMDSFPPSHNLDLVRKFIPAFVRGVYNIAGKPILSTCTPVLQQCQVQVQPNGHDCGTFALLNLKNAVYHLDDLLALRPLPNNSHFDFCSWYTPLLGVHYRAYLYQRYEELLHEYGEN
jgi:hypothetical protein